MDSMKVDTWCNHQWDVHTQTQFFVPTGEKAEPTGAEVRNVEMRVTKVYCIHCLEVKAI